MLRCKDGDLVKIQGARHKCASEAYETHVCFKVRPSQREFGADILFVHRMGPAPGADDAIERHAQPPCTASLLEVGGVVGWREVW